MRIVELKFSKYVSTLRENYRFILSVSLASCVTMFVGTEMLMDRLYWSEAQIQVLHPARSPVEIGNSDRAAVLVRERLTRQSLEMVIVDNGLYPEERSDGSLAGALKAMERDISTSVVRDDVVRLAFQASDPALAQRVTSHLASQYEDSKASTQEDRVLLGLSDEIKKAEVDLATQEEKVREFNLRFLGSHLEKQSATLAALNRLLLQLQSNADLLSALQEQRLSQERVLTLEEPQRSSGQPGPLDSKLQVTLPPVGSSTHSNASSLSFSERQAKIDQFNKEIDQRKKQQTEIRKEMAVHQAKIDSAPQVKALQSALVRDYDKAKLRYQELLAKRNEAEMAKAAKRKSEPSFRVLSPASFPDRQSNSLVSFVAKLSGLLLGPLLAIGLVVLRSRRAEPKVSLEQAISESGLPVLASIPWIPLGSGRPNSQLPDRDLDRSSTRIT